MFATKTISMQPIFQALKKTQRRMSARVKYNKTKQESTNGKCYFSDKL